MSLIPKVSIIMPAYNASKTIMTSIECVLKQTFQNWELLVINDGSTDNTLVLLSNLVDQRISVFTQLNQGVAAARNTGLKRARGAYIAFLDADDLWDQSKLEKQLYIFEESTDKLGLIYTKHRGFTEDPLHSFSMDVDASIGYQNPYHRLLIMDYIPTLTVMIRASIINEIGYFNQDLRGTEDWDYWIRITKLYKIHQINEELALYRISANSLSRNKEKHAIEELKVLDKHLTLDLNIPLAVCHMARAFWNLKKIRNQLQSGSIKYAVSSILSLITLQPVFYKNFIFIIIWIGSYIYKRKIIFYKPKVERR